MYGRTLSGTSPATRLVPPASGRLGDGQSPDGADGAVHRAVHRGGERVLAERVELGLGEDVRCLQHQAAAACRSMRTIGSRGSGRGRLWLRRRRLVLLVVRPAAVLAALVAATGRGRAAWPGTLGRGCGRVALGARDGPPHVVLGQADVPGQAAGVLGAQRPVLDAGDEGAAARSACTRPSAVSRS
ncbi:hypothetical protein GCM10025868_40910 [Angustibacter aerolatus]|uniref:Uncharacterized protein n=1 Tax=Angustibacter aerolatus TaxID=1162965 RepID=A0ABQ6JKQ4_9ACTN|nr:hypothetical protein GCM10025868_40910 [Angustibacter aerolatus]